MKVSSKKNIEQYSILLLTGGVGSRMKSNQPKQFIKLNGMPIIYYSLEAIKNITNIKELIINYPAGEKENLETIIRASGLKMSVIYVEAGDSRQNSVYKMIKKAKYENIIIHESARPIVNQKTFTDLIDSEFKNCGYMSKIPFTVAPVNNLDNSVSGNLVRDNLRNVLLPQKFVRKDLFKSHQKAMENNLVYTEDATLFACNNNDKFYFIDTEDVNIKITYPIDLKFAENILYKRDNDE